MIKFFLWLLCGLFFSSAQAQEPGSWYAGLSVGNAIADDTTRVDSDDAGVPLDATSEDVTLTGTKFFSGSVFVGKNIRSFSQGTLFGELSYSYNGEETSAVSNTAVADVKISIKRPMNFGMSAGFSKPLKDNVSVFVKLGVLLSQFKTGFDDRARAQLYTGTDSQFAWGFAPSVGIQKDIGDMTIGLVYSYYLYQTLAAKSMNMNSQITYINTITPSYHMLEARVSKKL